MNAPTWDSEQAEQSAIRWEAVQQLRRRRADPAWRAERAKRLAARRAMDPAAREAEARAKAAKAEEFVRKIRARFEEGARMARMFLDQEQRIAELERRILGEPRKN